MRERFKITKIVHSIKHGESAPRGPECLDAVGTAGGLRDRVHHPPPLVQEIQELVGLSDW